jgi:hypothetical protein
MKMGSRRRSSCYCNTFPCECSPPDLRDTSPLAEPIKHVLRLIVGAAALGACVGFVLLCVWVINHMSVGAAVGILVTALCYVIGRAVMA